MFGWNVMNELQRFLDLTYHKVKEKAATTTPITYKPIDAIYNRMIYVCTPINCTKNILEIFNKDTDLYVAQSLPAARNFKSDLGQDCFIFSTGYRNANSLRGFDALKTIERVFINVGPDAIVDKNLMAKIRRTIDNLETILPQKPIYIIT